jgi:alkanesulfonate monooxygenase SsuD/methylene tetrahydromethanopterin reductase-like flavin-dependent oxidoreductase (luciferase family)
MVPLLRMASTLPRACDIEIICGVTAGARVPVLWICGPAGVGKSAVSWRLYAELASSDLWNIAGGDVADAAQRSALLDLYCTETGRDPAAITRSIHLPVSYDQPDTTRDAISEALGAGFRHITLGLPAQPYPANVARWVADELIAKSA